MEERFNFYEKGYAAMKGLFTTGGVNNKKRAASRAAGVLRNSGRNALSRCVRARSERGGSTTPSLAAISAMSATYASRPDRSSGVAP